MKTPERTVLTSTSCKRANEFAIEKVGQGGEGCPTEFKFRREASGVLSYLNKVLAILQGSRLDAPSDLGEAGRSSWNSQSSWNHSHCDECAEKAGEERSLLHVDSHAMYAPSSPPYHFFFKGESRQRITGAHIQSLKKKKGVCLCFDSLSSLLPLSGAVPAIDEPSSRADRAARNPSRRENEF